MARMLSALALVVFAAALSFASGAPRAVTPPRADRAAVAVAQVVQREVPLQDSTCGDSRCSPPEDCNTCPQDCGSCCGDRHCAPPEDCRSCPADCGPCS